MKHAIFNLEMEFMKLIKLLSSLFFLGKVINAGALNLYVGSYTTDGEPVGNGNGIYQIELNPKNGVAQAAQLAVKATNPSYILIRENKLYTANEVGEYNGESSGFVAAYDIKPDGSLQLLNSQASGGLYPVHLSLNKSGQQLYVANYGSGAAGSAGISAYNLALDGALESDVKYSAYAGHGKDASRQSSPHTHSVYVINAQDKQDLILAVDLGLDKVFTYHNESQSNQLTLLAENVILDPHNNKLAIGPRHMAISQDNKFIYLVDELYSYIFVYALDSATGKMSFKQKIHTFNGALKGDRNYPANAVISPDQRYLYVANRGQNSIAQFSIKANGELIYIKEFSAEGDWPRDIALDASGKYLGIANQRSDNVTIYQVNQHNGNLSKAVKIAVPTPITLKFANFK